MNRARAVACVAAAGSVLVSLLLVPASAPVQAAPGESERIAFTSDRDEIDQATVTRTTDNSETIPVTTYAADAPAPGPVPFDPSSPPKHQGELSGLQGWNAYVSTVDNTKGEVYASLGSGVSRVRLTCNDALETHPVVSSGLDKVAWASDVDSDPSTPGSDWNIYVAVRNPEVNTHVGGVCDGWQARQVTANHADDLWPSFDEQGDRVVFSSTRDSNQLGDLYAASAGVTGPPETGLQQLTDDDAASTQPAVLEIGRTSWVVYTSTRSRTDGSLYVLRLPAANATTVPASESFWADGTRVLQSSEAAAHDGFNGFTAYVAFTTTAFDPYGDVYMGEVSSADGHPVLSDITAVARRPGIAETHAAWYDHFDDAVIGFMGPTAAAPDPNDVAVVTFTARAGDADVSTVSSDGTGDVRRVAHDTYIVPDNETRRFDEAGPAWSPDGESLVYTRDQGIFDRGRTVFTRAADGTGTATSLGVARSTNDVDLDPVWSPDGKRLAFTRYAWIPSAGAYVPSAVYVVIFGADNTPSAPRRVTPPLEASGVQTLDADPSWADDSRHLILERSRIGRGVPSSVTNGPNLVASRAQPRGTSLDESALYITDTDGTEPDVKLHFNPPCPDPGSEGCSEDGYDITGTNPSWSHSGNRIAYVYRGELWVTHLVRTADGIGWEADSDEPVIGFRTSGSEGPPEPTSARSRISWSDDPAWSPDDSEIAFAGQPAGQPDQRGIYAIRPDGSALRSVVDDRGPETEPAWSPDMQADVSVTVAVTGSPATPGTPLTATYTVTNNDPRIRSYGVVLTTGFTPGGTVAAASPPADCNPDGSGCSFDHLDPGESRQYAVTLTYPAPVTGTAQGTVTTTTPDPDLTNNTAQAPYTVVALPITAADVGVRVSVDKPVGYVGGHRTATVVVRNRGPATANAVTLATTYPSGTRPAFAAGPTTPACLDGSSTCSLGAMLPGTTKTFTVPLLMLHEGTDQMTATVSTTSPDANPANDTAAAKIKVLQPTIRLLPSVARPGAVVMAFGEKMPPGSKVTLLWVPGITVSGPVKFKVASDGTMRAQLLLVRHDLLGNRLVRATSVGGLFSPVEGPMLVAERLSTAPSFLARG